MRLRRKLAQFLASIKQEKPYYCEVEFLQSSGTQYIDTGWSPVSNDLRVKFKTTSVSAPNTTAVCGAEKSGITPRWVFILYGQSADTTKTFPLTGDWNNSTNGFTFTSGSVLEIDWTTSSTSTTITDSVSGTTYTHDFGSTINYSNNNITLKLFQNGDSQKSSVQINYYKIWDGGNLVRDFIPVLDWNMTPCMYDRVTGQLFYNAGTGDFVAGREVHYTEYLEGQGQQYIDTGIIGKTGILAKLKFKFGNNMVGNDKYVLGSSSISPAVRTYFGTYQSKWMYGCGNYKQAEGIADNTVYDCEVSWLKGNQYVIANGEKLIEWDQTTEFNNNFNLYLFSRNNGGSIGSFTSASTIYYCQIFDNGVLVRDYKPAIDENGIGYMFDRVSHTFFENKGTGAFKYSAVKADYIEVTSTPGLIDLELKYKPSMNIALKYMRTAQGESGSVFPLTNTTTNPLIYFPALNAGAKTDRFVWRRTGYTEKNYYLKFTAYPTPDYEVLLDADHDKLYIDGTLVQSGMIDGMAGYASPYESNSNLMMFSINKTYGGLGKVYYVKIWDKYQTYRDLVPAWKDGEFGMYDRAHDVLYKNTGGGTAVLGKISESHYFD